MPGEFTLRAFLAGKLDLPRAEAVLAVIEADTRDELKDALAQLAGELNAPLGQLRATSSTCSPTSRPASTSRRKTYLLSDPGSSWTAWPRAWLC